MIKEYHTNYLGKKESDQATRFPDLIAVYKSEEVKHKLKILLDGVRNARRSILDFEKDFESNKDVQVLVNNLQKVEQSIAEVETRVFSDIEFD